MDIGHLAVAIVAFGLLIIAAVAFVLAGLFLL